MVKNPFSSQKKGGDDTPEGAGIVSSRPIIISSSSDSNAIRDNLSRLQNKTRETKFDRVRHKDTKRSHIAMVFVYGYMITVAIIIIGAPVYNAIVLSQPEGIDIERILAQVGTLLGSPLGFVIGYYFKEDK